MQQGQVDKVGGDDVLMDKCLPSNAWGCCLRDSAWEEWASKIFRSMLSRPRIFFPCGEWAAKIFSVESHLTPIPPS